MSLENKIVFGGILALTGALAVVTYNHKSDATEVYDRQSEARRWSPEYKSLTDAQRTMLHLAKAERQLDRIEKKEIGHEDFGELTSPVAQSIEDNIMSANVGEYRNALHAALLTQELYKSELNFQLMHLESAYDVEPASGSLDSGNLRERLSVVKSEVESDYPMTYTWSDIEVFNNNFSTMAALTTCVVFLGFLCYTAQDVF